MPRVSLATRILLAPTLLDAALIYAAHGWYVFPLRRRGKIPAVGSAHTGDDPLVGNCGGWRTGCELDGHAQNDSTVDPEKIRAWWRKYPDANIGLHCEPSGLYGVDVDTAHGKTGDASWTALVSRHGAPPVTWEVETWSGGRHLIYDVEGDGQGLANSKGNLFGAHIDTRYNGYLVAPPSVVREDGATGTYRVVRGVAPAPLPAWVREAHREPVRPSSPPPVADPAESHAQDARARLREHADAIANYPDVGGANDFVSKTAFWVGQYVGAGQLSEVEAFAEIAGAVGTWNWRKPRDRSQMERTIRIGIKAGIRSPRSWEPPRKERAISPKKSATPGGGRPEDKPDEVDEDWDETGAGTKGGGSLATQLVEMALEHFDMRRGETGGPIAVPKAGGNLAYPVRGADGLSGRLRSDYYAATGKAASQKAMTDALGTLEGMAQDTDPIDVALRVGRGPQNSIVIDMGDESCRAVVVSSRGWETIDRSPILFRRTKAMGAHPEPVRDGSVDKLRGLVNLPDDLWELLVHWMVTAFIPGIPHPVPWINGEQGTGKTDAQRMIVKLIDPGPAPSRKAPRNDEDWVTAASGSWVVGLENLSKIPEWLSDSICRAVTGDADVRRALYTDGDLHVIKLQRVILMNGIEVGAIRGDLAERMLPLRLLPIPGHLRLREKEVEDRYEAARGEVFGGLLDLLVTLLERLERGVVMEEVPRMADFAECLVALDQVRGTKSYRTYVGLQSEQNAELLEADPLALAILAGMEKRDAWEGTAADLHKALAKRVAGEDGQLPEAFPRMASVMGKRLLRLAPALRKEGIHVTASRTGRGMRYQLRRVTTDGSQLALEAPDGGL